MLTNNQCIHLAFKQCMKKFQKNKLNMKPKLSTQDLRVFMGWVRDYCDNATAPKTPEEMKILIEEMFEVEIENISEVEQFFNEQYDYEGYIEEKVETYDYIERES